MRCVVNFPNWAEFPLQTFCLRELEKLCVKLFFFFYTLRACQMIIFLFCCLLFAFIVVAGVHHVLHIIPHPVAVSQAGLCCPLFPSISSFLISHWSAEPIHNFCCVACLMCFFCCFLLGGVSHSSYRLFLLGCSQNERCVTPCITFLFPVSPSNCSLFL